MSIIDAHSEKLVVFSLSGEPYKVQKTMHIGPYLFYCLPIIFLFCSFWDQFAIQRCTSCSV